MGRKSNYNFQAIEKERELGLDWDTIAGAQGKKGLTVKRAYYRWISRGKPLTTEPKKKTVPKIKAKITTPESKKNLKEEDINDYLKAVQEIEDISSYLEENNKSPTFIKDSDTLRHFYKLMTGKGSRDRIDVVKMKIVSVLVNSLDPELQNLFKLVTLSDA